MNKLSYSKVLIFVPFLILISISFLPKATSTTQEIECPYVEFYDEYQVNNITSEDQSHVQIASIGSKNEKYVIVWSTSSGGPKRMTSSSKKKQQNQNQNIQNLEQDDYGVFAQIFNSSDGSKIGNEFLVNNYTDNDQSDPRITSIGTNNEKFVIAWESYGQDDSGGYGVFAQIFDSSDGSKIGNEFQVNNYTDNHQSDPSVAPIGTNKEKFVIAWTSYVQDGSGYGIFSQIFDSSDGSKIGNEFQVNNYTDSHQFRPSITSIGTNNEKFVITWQSSAQDGSSYGIFSQIFNSSDGSKIGNEFLVNNSTDNTQSDPMIASIGNNNEKFLIAWESYDQDGSAYGIFAQIYDSSDGSKIGNEFQVNNYTDSHQSDPSISSIGTNNEKFVISWTSNGQDGSDYAVIAQIYDSSDGSKIGNEFQVNTYTDNHQETPSIASIGENNEDFVIAWESYGQDGSMNGIFAQHYKISENPEINEQIPQTQYFEKNNQFNFQFSSDSFQNPNEPGNFSLNLIYEAKLSNGNDLPDGLNFDSNNRQFSGSVSIEDSCQNWEIEIFAINQCNEQVSQNFTLSNPEPEINQTIPDQVLSYGLDDYSDYQFQIPQDSFSDNQESELDLNYDAKLVVVDNNDQGEEEEEEQDLPEWLIFNENTRTFTINEDYQSTRTDMGNYTIKVYAIDYCNLNISQSFNFELKNDSPYLNKPIDDIELNEDDSDDDGNDDIYIFIFDEDTFIDPNNDELSYTVYFNGIEDYLPCWIKFIESKRKFIFDVESANEGNHIIKIKASDDLLDSFNEFNLRVVKKSSTDTDTDDDNDNDNNNDTDTNNTTDDKNEISTGIIIGYTVNGLILIIIIIIFIIIFKKKNNSLSNSSRRKKSNINIDIEENKSDDIIMSGSQDIELSVSNNTNN
ncbi:proline-rich receptor-like protein kinase perk13-related [Anaeramoeba flamelloides]|uniref:Proline-rich receptor-like protein kinase perk13-related n=1 Tax=Anaeramoeba flamelloides TaxID=1746091 RepID=A0AAV7ZM38_9EUKA|nr:proline-rich receptor-like protein kinase perk13-related [Anaeramoeba flamelloides]